MLAIDYCSDLHIDRYHVSPDWAKLKNPGSTILIVAGDITNNSYISSWDKLKKAARHYDKVLFVDGNHEHYDSGMSIESVEKYFTIKSFGLCGDESYNHGKIIYLPGCEIYSIYNYDTKKEISIVGMCGWYDWNVAGITKYDSFRSWERASNDSRLIKHGQMTMTDRAKLHKDKLMERVRAAKNKQTIVVTHTAPTESLLMHGTGYDYLNGSYCNSMMEELFYEPNITHWIYGHTHNPMNTTIGNINFLNNVRGYKGEIQDWKLEQIVIN